MGHSESPDQKLPYNPKIWSTSAAADMADLWRGRERGGRDKIGVLTEECGHRSGRAQVVAPALVLKSFQLPCLYR